MLGEFGEDREFLRREVDRRAVARHGAVEQVDADTADLDRLLIAFGAKLDQVGDVAVELQRFGRRWSRPSPFVAGASPKLARRRADRCRGAGVTSWPIDDEQRRAQPVALAGPANSRASSRKPCPFERQRDLVEQAAEQRQLLLG